jgi:DNA-binding response OmpR family regulator
MKVLIVEDEVIPANYLKRLLELEGYEVLESIEQGSEAIKIAKQELPDIILMDIMLEDNISGCDAALRISKQNPKILIVFLTAYSDKEMIDFAVASKAFGYLLKPYREKEILATLALAKAHLHDQLEGKKSITTSVTEITLSGGYMYNIKIQKLLHKNKEVHLGPQAIKLIALLCQKPHHVFQTDMILTTLWDIPKSPQALRSLVYRIRESTISTLILNSSKNGYQISLDTESNFH